MAVAAASHGRTRAVSDRNLVGLARSISVMAFLIIVEALIVEVLAGNVRRTVS
jgi:hypothetical protein